MYSVFLKTIHHDEKKISKIKLFNLYRHALNPLWCNISYHFHHRTSLVAVLPWHTHTEMCHIVIRQYVAVVLFSKWLVFKAVCVWIEASVSFKKGCSVHITFLSFTTTEKLCICFVWIQRGLRFQCLFKGMWLVYAICFFFALRVPFYYDFIQCSKINV